jgi:thioesterase domain-containing protein/aryl carrier-like protein
LNLSLDNLDREENLMNLGFDSLMLNAFVREMNECFPSVDLTPAALFEFPTVQGMAAFLHDRQAGPAQRSPASSLTGLVVMERRGHHPPSFWVPGSFGFAQTFSALPRALGPDYPVYAFQAKGTDGKELPFVSVEEAATRYLYLLRTERPDGPYVLGGYSWGGLVALEMATRLAREGSRVEKLILFDTYPPVPEIYTMTQKPENQEKIRLILANYLAAHQERDRPFQQSDLDGIAPRLRDAHLVRLIAERGRTAMSESEIFSLFRGAIEVNDFASEAYQSWRPSRYDASEVLYFRSAHKGDDYIGDFDYVAFWRDLLGERLIVRPTTYTHANLVTASALAELTSEIKTAFEPVSV